jgi:hypothetical protein
MHTRCTVWAKSCEAKAPPSDRSSRTPPHVATQAAVPCVTLLALAVFPTHEASACSASHNHAHTTPPPESPAQHPRQTPRQCVRLHCTRRPHPHHCLARARAHRPQSPYLDDDDDDSEDRLAPYLDYVEREADALERARRTPPAQRR